MSYRATVLADEPLLYWPLGDSGAVIEDHSGNGRSGELKNSAAIGGAGLLTGDSDTAVTFVEASKSYVKSVAYEPFSGTKTFEVWAWRSASHANHDAFFCSSKTAGSSFVLAYVAEGTTNIRLTLNGFGTTATWEGAWPGDEQSVHIVFVINPSTLKATLYVNGVSKGEKTITAYGATPGNLLLSHDGSLGGVNGAWPGRLDEAAIYEGALSAERILAHHTAGTNAPAAREPGCYWGEAVDGDTYSIGAPDFPYVALPGDKFEEHAGRKGGIVHFADPWLEAGEGGLTWDGFGAGASQRVHDRGAIVLKTIGLDEAGVLQDLLAGVYDDSLVKWAQDARDFGHPFFLRPLWECNGDWYAWGRDPDYVAAWRYLHRIISAIAKNATFVWCPNVIYDSASQEYLESMFPGVEYVDWMAMDGYTSTSPIKNVGWKSAKTLFTPTYIALLALHPDAPVMICETAASETGGSKPIWLRNLLDQALPEDLEQVEAVVYFNWNIEEKPGERIDWPIESSAPAEASYKAGSANTYYAAPNAAELLAGAKVPRPGEEQVISPTQPAVAAGPSASVPDIAHPVRVVNGDVAIVEQGTPAEIEQCVEAALHTIVGSRIDALSYGIPDELFKQLGPGESADAYLAAVEAVEPRAHLLGEARIEAMVKRVTIKTERSGA